MIGRIVEIAAESRYLAVERGFLQIYAKSELLGQVPLDDVAALIANAHGLSYSNQVLLALAERGVPVVLCGNNHCPVAVVWPIESHHRQAARMDAQLNATVPLRKRLWKQLVRGKIQMQAEALGFHGLPNRAMLRLAQHVKSGDPANLEGQAARMYWTLLFGPEFRRDRQLDGINSLLNYGYTVLRSTVARHVIAAGLHPGIALFHKNEGNAMRLVDDVMEPFRPLVDIVVKQLADAGNQFVIPETKRELAKLPARSLRMSYGISPVTLVIQRLCVSLAKAYEDPVLGLSMPEAGFGILDCLLDEHTPD